MGNNNIFYIDKTVGRARAGRIVTAHGTVQTPVFMPVGTQGSVKSLSPDDLTQAGAQILLGNTYHLHLRPGENVVSKCGGLHEFMRWSGPILTDSGGYQVSSLGYFRDESSQLVGGIKKSQVDDLGVTFWSHVDGSEHRIDAEKSIQIQYKLGADIIMAFDEATPEKGKYYAKKAMQRTHRWLLRSKDEWLRLTKEEEKGAVKCQLFGIIQGGNYRDLRRESAKFVVDQELPGIAIGGGSIGKNVDQTTENVDWLKGILPKTRPLYLMGVGVGPRDIIAAISVGADMFDCVAPTRIARMGGLYSGKLRVLKKKSDLEWRFESEFESGRMNIANERFKTDKRVIEEDCDCYTCKEGFGRAYLRHLFKSRELLYYRLASIHNTRLMIRLVEEMRNSIMTL